MLIFKAMSIDKEGWKPRWVYGSYLPEACITGENFTGFIETYGDAVGAIIVDSVVAWEVDPLTLCQSTPSKDVLDKLIYVNDILNTGDGKRYLVKAASHYVVSGPEGNIVMPALLCEYDGNEIMQLIQRSDGTWIVENSIRSVNIKVIDNLFGPVE
jgi:hypothetical protein